MKLEKAIVRLQEILDDEDSDWEQDCRDALMLGIEAAKRVEHHRTGHDPYALDLLPGETKD